MHCPAHYSSTNVENASFRTIAEISQSRILLAKMLKMPQQKNPAK